MTKAEETVKCEDCMHHHGHKRMGGAHAGGAVYGIGMIGALVYYLTTAASFWLGVLGILKAIVWPAFVVFELMKYLHL